MLWAVHFNRFLMCWILTSLLSSVIICVRFVSNVLRFGIRPHRFKSRDSVNDMHTSVKILSLIFLLTHRHYSKLVLITFIFRLNILFLYGCRVHALSILLKIILRLNVFIIFAFGLALLYILYSTFFCLRIVFLSVGRQHLPSALVTLYSDWITSFYLCSYVLYSMHCWCFWLEYSLFVIEDKSFSLSISSFVCHSASCVLVFVMILCATCIVWIFPAMQVVRQCHRDNITLCFCLLNLILTVAVPVLFFSFHVFRAV